MIKDDFFTCINNYRTVFENYQKEIPENFLPDEDIIFYNNKLHDLQNNSMYSCKPLDNGIMEDSSNNNNNIQDSNIKDNNTSKQSENEEKHRLIYFSKNLENYSDKEKLNIQSLEKSITEVPILYNILVKDSKTIFDFFRFYKFFNYNIQETIDSILKYISHFEEGYSSNKTYLKLIKLGYFYIQGRDKNFRPNLVFDICRFISYSSNIEYGDFLRSIVFVLEFVTKFMLLRGKVENWNLILNFNLNDLYKDEEFTNNIKHLNSKIYLVKFYFSELLMKLEKMYPYRINEIFIYRNTDSSKNIDLLKSDHVLQKNTNLEYELYSFFSELIPNKSNSNIKFVENNNLNNNNNFLSTLIDKNIALKKVVKISLLELFNIYINKNEIEEKYFGSKDNIKLFFSYVNKVYSRNNSIKISKRESAKFSEVSEYESVRSINEHYKLNKKKSSNTLIRELQPNNNYDIKYSSNVLLEKEELNHKSKIYTNKLSNNNNNNNNNNNFKPNIRNIEKNITNENLNQLESKKKLKLKFNSNYNNMLKEEKESSNNDFNSNMGLAESTNAFYTDHIGTLDKAFIKSSSNNYNSLKYNSNDILKEDQIYNKIKNFTELESEDDKLKGGCCKGGKCILF